LSERDCRLVWAMVGLLLDYPGDATLSLLPELRSRAAVLPAPAGPALVLFLDDTARRPTGDLAAHYVETFDLRRRNCLHLTYFAHGDTRARGMALLRLKHAYRAAGAEMGDHELPDHLSVVLEFAAAIDQSAGRRLLLEYRPVLELLRRSLADDGSRYALLFEALAATLPELSPADLRRVAQLAKAGPPSEEVGLEPFAVDPALDALSGAPGLEGVGGRR